MSDLYLYLSGNWELSDPMSLVYSLDCCRIPSPAPSLCFYIFVFPNHYLSGQPFETPGGLGEESFSTNKRQAEDMVGGLSREGRIGSCLVSIAPFFLIALSAEGNRYTRKGVVLDGEVNHQLSRGTQFQGTRF